jgi:two-component system, sensor histidine kinase PdtaS
LSVGDNGVGMPAEPKSAKAGLGTTLIEALAKQLRAGVRIADGYPGTVVSISHTQVAALALDEGTAPALKVI